MENTPNLKIGIFEIQKKIGKKLACQKLAKKNLAKSKIKKKLARNWLAKLAIFPTPVSTAYMKIYFWIEQVHVTPLVHLNLRRWLKICLEKKQHFVLKVKF